MELIVRELEKRSRNAIKVDLAAFGVLIQGV
jgi:hypothetical protein